MRGPADEQPNEPGWWFASDGKWYPPELWHPPESPTRARTSRTVRRVLTGIAVVVAVIVIGVVALFWRGNSDTWSRIRREAARFSPPAGWTPVGKAEQGSGACVISCDEPRVTLVFRTEAAPHEACDQLRVAVIAQVGSAPNDPYMAWCGWRAPFPSDDQAYVVGGAETVATLQGEYPPLWTDKVSPTGDGTLVWVEFSSGID